MLFKHHLVDIVITYCLLWLLLGKLRLLHRYHSSLPTHQGSSLWRWLH